MKIINHAIIGCGRVAKNHIMAARSNGMNVVCCCDFDVAKAKKIALDKNIPNYTDDYKVLIDDPRIDSVSICTDHQSHTFIASDFLDKKHMIIEKPLSSDLQSAIDFCGKAKRSSKKIMVISQHRYDDIMKLVKKMLEDKAMGNVTMINVELACSRDDNYYLNSYWRGKKEKEGGSTVINQAYHLVDLIVYLFGMPNEVKSYCDVLKFKNIIDTEDSCAALFRYNGCLCTFSTTNTATKVWATRVKITGTKGDIEFNIDFPPHVTNTNLEQNNYDSEILLINNRFKENLNNPINYYGLSHINQFENFAKAILYDDAIDVTVDEALKTLKLINLIYNS